MRRYLREAWNDISNGENLDLWANGHVGMADGMGDVTITGAMSQDVAGRLGLLGEFSLNKILGIVPGLGFWPGKNRGAGLLHFVPGVGYVPGFGGTVQNINKFRVELSGNLGADPPPVKSVAWVR
jgi:hypothetical protein